MRPLAGEVYNFATECVRPDGCPCSELLCAHQHALLAAIGTRAVTDDWSGPVVQDGAALAWPSAGPEVGPEALVTMFVAAILARVANWSDQTRTYDDQARVSMDPSTGKLVRCGCGRVDECLHRELVQAALARAWRPKYDVHARVLAAAPALETSVWRPPGLGEDTKLDEQSLVALVDAVRPLRDQILGRCC